MSLELSPLNILLADWTNDQKLVQLVDHCLGVNWLDMAFHWLATEWAIFQLLLVLSVSSFCDDERGGREKENEP